MTEIFLNSKPLAVFEGLNTASDVKAALEEQFGIRDGLYYLTAKGKKVHGDDAIKAEKIHCHPRVLGGKGGFGSMLRAIGAQIEKTTNREACRDLSGRRLRDINEEKRLKKWIDAQAEREKEAQDRKQKKLERLCQSVKHEFKDENYEKERSALPEKVVDALEHGLKAGQKRKTEPAKEVMKKRPKLWVDDLAEDELSSSDDNSDEDSKLSTSAEQKMKKLGDDSDAEDVDEEKTASSEQNTEKSNEGVHLNSTKETNDEQEMEKLSENESSGDVNKEEISVTSG